MVNSRILTVHREKKYFSSQKKKRKRKKKLYMRLYSFGEYWEMLLGRSAKHKTSLNAQERIGFVLWWYCPLRLLIVFLKLNSNWLLPVDSVLPCFSTSFLPTLFIRFGKGLHLPFTAVGFPHPRKCRIFSLIFQSQFGEKCVYTKLPSQLPVSYQFFVFSVNRTRFDCVA